MLQHTLNKMKTMKNASEVFVPKKFVELLDKRDLSHLRLGNCCMWPVMSGLPAPFLFLQN